MTTNILEAPTIGWKFNNSLKKIEIFLFPEYLLFFLSVFFVVYRLFLGVDFSDDAYLISSCARYLSGGLPFIDEYNMHQTASFLIYPFIKFHYLLFGFDGILLYTRFVGVFLASFCALFVAYFLRNILPSYGIFFISLFILCARPQHDPSCSYNFMVTFLSTITFFGFYRAIYDNSKIIFCISMFFLGLCCISYPTTIIIVPYFLFLGKDIFPLKKYIFILFSFSILFLSIAGYCFVNFSSIIYSYLDYVSFYHAYAFGDMYLHGNNSNNLLKIKFLRIFEGSKDKWTLLYLFLILGSFFLFFFTKIKKEKIFFPLSISALLCISAIYSFRHVSSQNLHFISYIAWLAPVYFLFLDKEKKNLYLLSIVWVPSFIMAFILSFTSAGGAQNLSLGFYPASIITFIYYFQACSNKRKIWFFPLYGIIFYLIYLQYVVIYRDENFLQLKVQIQEGPYKALFTTLEKKNFIDEVKKQLTVLETQNGKSKSILFAYSFSGGYLMSNLIPSTPSIWLLPPIPNEFYKSYFNTYNRKNPDFIFIMKRIPYGTEWYEPFGAKTMPIVSFLQENKYHKIYESKNFDIFSHHTKSVH